MQPYTPVQDIFNHLSTVIPSDQFQNQEGLGNEVPFFICPYDPADSTQIRDIYAPLFSKFRQQGITVRHIDLYDLSIEILKTRKIWDKLLEQESNLSKSQLYETLSNVLDPETHLAPAIAGKITDEKPDVLFLTGVGRVYPYIRSHKILNNLQSTAKGFPTVMFFPGNYTQSLSDGASLNLFGLLSNDKYYRAFNILTYEI